VTTYPYPDEPREEREATVPNEVEATKPDEAELARRYERVEGLLNELKDVDRGRAYGLVARSCLPTGRQSGLTPAQGAPPFCRIWVSSVSELERKTFDLYGINPRKPTLFSEGERGKRTKIIHTDGKPEMNFDDRTVSVIGSPSVAVIKLTGEDAKGKIDEDFLFVFVDQEKLGLLESSLANTTALRQVS